MVIALLAHLRSPASLSNWISNVTGDKINMILGNERREVVGKCEIKIGADIMKLFCGAQHETVIGITSKTIGGWKRESIWASCRETSTRKSTRT